MPYLIGTDEAGYGPNLGPLTISVSVWHVAGDPLRTELYQKLAGTICADAASAASPAGALAGDGPIVMADSKALYKSGGTLELLERGVLAALAAIERRPRDWWSLWSAVEADPDGEVPLLPWHVGFERPLPVASPEASLDRSAERLQAGLKRAKVRLVALRSRAIFPRTFNELVREHGTKGETLSRLTLGLLAEVLPVLDGSLDGSLDGPVLVICDKHGGRNYYQRLLQLVFPDSLVEVQRESPAESIYRWGPKEGRVEVRFRAKGESFLPAALASMTCKYLRELAMLAFNDFWCCRVPNLRPTAGYPADAARFKDEISAVQQELAIDDHILWRTR